MILLLLSYFQMVEVFYNHRNLTFIYIFKINIKNKTKNILIIITEHLTQLDVFTFRAKPLEHYVHKLGSQH